MPDFNEFSADSAPRVKQRSAAAKPAGPKPAVMLAALVMAALLLLYVGAVLYRVVVMLQTGSVTGALLALGMLVLSLVAIWAVWREVRFGIAATRLTRKLNEAGGLLDLEIPTDPSGRPQRAAARQVLPEVTAFAQAQPESWQAQQRLGIVLRAAGENAAARKAINNAIKLAKSQDI
ncbi:hypothetical protein [Canibacter oris]|uniref:Tetratricopeptide repeat protein n=1 Tax=Canibacter oris TaxID=1365628 RepID=A0A840DFZ6_9MICO|nr:hypothetical protein [Canibacter oris]MBB4071640.1 hypothetical protein [Canibacter oris]